MKDKIKKVLYLDHGDKLGGAEKSLLLLLNHLDRKKYEPLLGCLPDTPLEKEAKKAGLKVVPVEMPRLKGSLNPFDVFTRLIRGIRSVERIIRKEGIDLIHGNVVRASIYGAIAACLCRVPFIWHARDIHQQESFLTALLPALSVRVIAISEAVKRHLPYFAQQKTVVVPNGIDLKELEKTLKSKKRGVFRKELHIPQEAVLVGNVGWISFWKGQDKFLEVAKRVLWKRKDVYFVVVGGLADSKYESWVKGLKKEAQKLNGHFIFAGPREDIWEAMMDIDILVHCAEKEPFGRIFLEAMTCKKPVVAFADGGAPEVVKEGETGFLVPPEDLEEMSKAVLRLVENAKLRSSMGKRGRLRVERFYEIGQVTSSVEKVYEQVLSK